MWRSPDSEGNTGICGIRGIVGVWTSPGSQRSTTIEVLWVCAVVLLARENTDTNFCDSTVRGIVGSPGSEGNAGICGSGIRGNVGIFR